MKSLHVHRHKSITKDRVDRYLGLVLISAAIIVALFFTLKANLDLTQGRYALYMDERISFDGVKQLLHPVGFGSFLDNIIDGGDHRYGRILWNLSALTSFLPERIWGDSGQIVATRMTQAIVQFFAFGVLVFTFIRSWTLRGFALLILICLPYTDYFASMPKPDPLQLASFAIFLAFAKSNQYRFGYYWFFIGIAFGAKVSTLTLIPLFAIIGLANQFIYADWVYLPVAISKVSSPKKVIRFGLIILGSYQVLHGLFLISQGSDPDLVKKIVSKLPFDASILYPLVSIIYSLIPISLGLAFFTIPLFSKYLEKKSYIRFHSLLKTVGVFLLGFCISVPIVFFKFPSGWLAWLHSTLLNTSHGSDDSSVNLFTWLDYIFNDYVAAPEPLLLATFIAFIALFIAALFLSNGPKHNKRFKDYISSLVSEGNLIILLLVAFLSVFPILLSVNRLWGHYLHIGTVFFVVAVFVSIEFLLSSISSPFLSRNSIIVILSFTLGLQVITTAFYMLPAMATRMNNIAHRTSSSEFLRKKSEYDYLTNLFKAKSSVRSKPLSIFIGASIFIPDTTSNWEVNEIFGYFNNWLAEPDLVIMYRADSPLSKHHLPSSAQYNAWLSASNIMQDHLSSDNKTCSIQPCYLELSSPYKDLLILSKSS